LLGFESDDTPLALPSIKLGSGLDFLDMNGDSRDRERTLAPR
jgi:hypothetical protein